MLRQQDLARFCGQVAGYAGLLLATPTVLYEVVSYVVPGLTKSEKDMLAPIVFGSSILFYVGSVKCPVFTQNKVMFLACL